MVGTVIADVKKHFKHVVCVDDGSRDGSNLEILKAGATLVQHPINLGAGGAIQTGIDFALQDPKAQYFITFDADGQHHIEDAVTMYDYIKAKKVDIVFGSRFIGVVRNISPVKKLFLKAAAIFSRQTTGVNITDPHIGIRALNRKFAENLEITMPDFSHASEIIHRVGEGGFKYAEIPVTVTYSDYSKAKGQPMLNSINITTDLFLQRFTKK